ncbi:PREDICTED: uncharacterized protein LOC104825418 isoform X1 [Tarenaya hassleriana]|uniref:uncharacterized protein LOC104825418 isoform X1 n=1 Tax=Tarenaya hassleriana TaxID=28532 RepID=UPI00053C0B74|nr:PREDICTED: uncharacterized protein LOC104825418 isoform X1 [Tarenaya hassleriana]
MAVNIQNIQPVSIFDGQNYELWATRMKTTLMLRELWDIVEKGVPPQTSETTETPTKNQETDLTKWRKIKMKDMPALQLLQHSITDSVFRKVITATTSNEVWSKLQEAYQALMEKTKDLRSINVTDLVGSLITHESKFLPDEEGNSEGAFPPRSKNHKGGNKGL